MGGRWYRGLKRGVNAEMGNLGGLFLRQPLHVTGSTRYISGSYMTS
jgi:hypothetical protein